MELNIYWPVLATVSSVELGIYRQLLAIVPTIKIDIYRPVLATVPTMELNIYIGHCSQSGARYTAGSSPVYTKLHAGNSDHC